MTILSLGEALVDWVSTTPGLALPEAEQWVKAPGGAPFNLAMGLARLGAPVAFAGCLGSDPFGGWLFDLLRSEGVDISRVRTVPRQTRMAFVTTTREGDRSLAAFTTEAVADPELGEDDLRDLTDDFLCFGTLILQQFKPREAIYRAAHDFKGLVVFDPNLRPVLWEDLSVLRGVLERFCPLADLLKLGADELAWLCPERPLSEAAAFLLERFDLSALFLTLGAEGAYFRTPRAEGRVSGFPVPCIDATGAGDGFLAGLLFGLERAGIRTRDALRALDEKSLARMVRVANAVGAQVVTKAGATAGLPTLAQLEAFLAGDGMLS